MSTSELLLERFRTVDDPAFDEDVVSLGLVADVAVRDGVAAVSLAFNAPLSPAEVEMCDEIRACCRGVGLEPILFAADDRRSPAFSTVKNAVAVGSIDGSVDPSFVGAALLEGFGGIGAAVGALIVEASAGRGTWLESVDPIVLGGEPAAPQRRFDVPAARLDVHLPDGDPPPAVDDVFRALLAYARDGVEWGPLDYLVVVLPPGDSATDATLEELPVDGLVLASRASTPGRAIDREIRARLRRGDPLLGVVETGNGVRRPNCGEVGGRRAPPEALDDVPILASLPVDDWLAGDGEPSAFDPTDRPGERLRALARSVADRLGAKHRASVAELDGDRSVPFEPPDSSAASPR
ncbi:iron-sulfur cluster assembly protein [Natrialbaceae archaeon GCM10025810]|uniref:iron-sulfur cluster assembly protein n=1 Tax=Halovalidus salilacus TaxID=3075124 RepID=UPI003608B9BC